MDIAVIGPCGDVGRHVVCQIVIEQLLTCEQRLVLVANPGGSSARSAHGLAADLVDAYSDIIPQIEIVMADDEWSADLIVMAAGATPRGEQGQVPMTRDALANRNAPIFREHAEAIARNGTGHEIVVCVSNPNELAVGLFAQLLGRRRVIGMGAYLDSLRFREAIARDLGVRRQHIHAFVAGEHGAHLIPLWSTVHAFGYGPEPLTKALRELRGGITGTRFQDVVQETLETLKPWIAAGDIARAYRHVDRLPPDVRVATRPFVTHYSGAKTIIATAKATMGFLKTITQGNDALVSGQIALDGEAYGIRAPIGIPFVVGNQGVDRVFELPLTDDERQALCRCADAVRAKIDPYM